MSRKKLTLSVEERLTRRAKAIAKKRGTSVSQLVETFFTALEEDTTEVEQALQRAEGNPSDGSDDAPTEGYEPSGWARQWRGAFVEEGETYPDDPSWEKEVLAEEIEKKHAS